MEPYIRDTRKLRDKIEIAIDPRQIALLVIGEVLLLVLVFILGFGIGRSQRAKPQAELAQQIVQPEEQQMIVEQGTEEVPAPEQEQPSQEAESEPPRDELTLPPDEQPVYTVDLSDDSESSTPQITASEPSEPSPSDEQNLIIELPAQEQQEQQVDRAEPTPEPESDREQEPTAPTPPEPTGSPSGRYYTVQVSAFDTPELAQRYIEQLEKRYHLSAYMTEGRVRGKTWYRVRIGRFQEYEKAKEFADALERKLGIKPFIDLVSE